MEGDNIWFISGDPELRSRSCNSRSKYAKFAYSIMYMFIINSVEEKGKEHLI